MNSQPPLFTTTRFNDRAFQFSNYITKEQAEQYFISNLFMPMPGIAQASKLLLLNAASSISGINSFGVTSITLNGTPITASATEINYNDVTTIGVAEASKALILDSDSRISGIHTLTATNLTSTNLTGTLITAAQPNITSIGTQLDLRVNGFIQQSFNITSDSFRSIRSASTFKMIHNLNDEMQLGMTTDNAMSFITNNVNRMTIASNGRISVVNSASAASSSDASVTLSGGLGVASNIIAGTSISAPTISATTSMNAPQYIGRFRCNQADNAATTFESATNAFQISSDPAGALSSMNVYMGCSSTNNNAFIQCSKNVSPFFGRLLLNPRGGGCLIGATSTTETQVLVVSGTTRITGLLTVNGVVSSVDEPLKSVRGTSTFRVFHTNNEDAYIGTTSSNTFHLVTANINRLTVAESGDISIANSLNVNSNATIGATTTSNKLVIESDLASNGPILGGLWEGAASVAGGMTIAKNLWIGTTLNVSDYITATNDVTSRRLILNAENNNIRINKPSEPDAYTTLSFNSGLLDNHFEVFSQRTGSNWSTILTVGLRDSGTQQGGRMSLAGSIRNGSLIDCGNNLRPNAICIQQTNNLTPSNQLGCNATHMTFTSAQSGGFSFHSNRSTSIGQLENEGDRIVRITTLGEIRANNNVMSDRGVHSNGFGITGELESIGDSAHMHYSGQAARFFGYNYGTPLAPNSWRDVSIGNDRIYITDATTIGNVGLVGIGTTSPTYPLDVQRTVTASLSGGYGWLSPSGTGTGSGTGSVSMSIRAAGRIVCPEFNAHSDRRIKEHIIDIGLDTALKFVNDVTPRQYNLIGSSDVDFGYIAQEILETDDPLINDIVTWHPDEMMVDDDESPAGYKASVSYNECIPLLHRALQNALERIEQLEARLQPKKSLIVRPKDSKGRFISPSNKTSP